MTELKVYRRPDSAIKRIQIQPVMNRMAMSKMQEQDHHLEWNKIQSIGMMNQR
jgi:hypothetical protein